MRKLKIKIKYFLFFTLGLLCLLELYLQLRLAGNRIIPLSIYKFDKVLGHDLSPNSSGLSDATGEQIHYIISRYGSRKNSQKRLASSDKCDINAFGASRTFGFAQKAVEAWPAQLGHKLKNNNVKNFGVPGYGLDQVYLKYVKSGRHGHVNIFYLDFYNSNRYLKHYNNGLPKPYYSKNLELETKHIDDTSPLKIRENFKSLWHIQILKNIIIYFNPIKRTDYLSVEDDDEKKIKLNIISRIIKLNKERGQTPIFILNHERSCSGFGNEICINFINKHPIIGSNKVNYGHINSHGANMLSQRISELILTNVRFPEGCTR